MTYDPWMLTGSLMGWDNSLQGVENMDLGASSGYDPMLSHLQANTVSATPQRLLLDAAPRDSVSFSKQPGEHVPLQPKTNLTSLPLQSAKPVQSPAKRKAPTTPCNTFLQPSNDTESPGGISAASRSSYVFSSPRSPQVLIPRKKKRSQGWTSREVQRSDSWVLKDMFGSEESDQDYEAEDRSEEDESYESDSSRSSTGHDVQELKRKQTKVPLLDGELSQALRDRIKAQIQVHAQLLIQMHALANTTSQPCPAADASLQLLRTLVHERNTAIDLLRISGSQNANNATELIPGISIRFSALDCPILWVWERHDGEVHIDEMVSLFHHSGLDQRMIPRFKELRHAARSSATFLPADIQLLHLGVMRYGGDFARIQTRFLPCKSLTDIQMRYAILFERKQTVPTVERRERIEWTEDQRRKLVKGYLKYGTNWKYIATTYFKGTGIDNKVARREFCRIQRHGLLDQYAPEDTGSTEWTQEMDKFILFACKSHNTDCYTWPVHIFDILKRTRDQVAQRLSYLFSELVTQT